MWAGGITRWQDEKPFLYGGQKIKKESHILIPRISWNIFLSKKQILKHNYTITGISVPCMHCVCFHLEKLRDNVSSSIAEPEKVHFNFVYSNLVLKIMS